MSKTKLTDMDKKMILTDHLDGVSNMEIAKKFDISRTHVRRVIKSFDPDNETVKKQIEANDEDIAKYLEEKRKKALKFIDLALDEMCNPDKIKGATLNQIATAFGIICDKYGFTEYTYNSDTSGKVTIINDLPKTVDLNGKKQTS